MEAARSRWMGAGNRDMGGRHMEGTMTSLARARERITDVNPMGTDGFEFVEYTAPDTADLARLFQGMGFRAVARHRSKDVTLYRQGDLNFIINAEPDSFPQASARKRKR